jgi:acyl-CoA thioester hydrolase
LIFYRLRNAGTAGDIANAKTGIVFFDYQERKIIPLLESFRTALLDDAREQGQVIE